MKTLPLLGIISLLAVPLVGTAQVTTIFNDTFPASNHSVLNSTAASPGPLSSTRTSYEIASSKTGTSTTLGTGVLTLSTASTSSGYTEAQALFTTTPVALTTAGQYLDVYFTFTDSANTFNTTGTVGNNMQIGVGLFNSGGGSAPTNGTLLWGGGLVSGATTAVSGGTKNWTGYAAQFAFTPSGSSGNSSSIATRPAQTGANNLNQALGVNSGYASGANITTLSTVAGQPFLTVGNQYTVHLRITYVDNLTYAITNTLFNGAGIGGSIFSAGGWTGQFGKTTTSILANSFDGLVIGYRPTTSTATTLAVNSVTVTLTTPIAPAISGLTNQTVIQGTSTTLSPTVIGVPVPAYQWQLTNGAGGMTNIPGATSASLALNNVLYAQNGNIYSLIATNSLGAVTNSMTLSVIITPSITGLNNQAAGVGDTVTISPTVTGVPTPVLQWRTNGVNVADGPDANGSIIAGSTTSTLYITNAQAADSVTYSLVASNSAGIVTNSMSLTVSSGNQMPIITGPANITAVQGSNVTFSAAVSGVPVPTLQWLDQTQTPIAGATNATLTLNNVSYAQNGFVYSLVASNDVGSVTNGATLTVIVPPAITSQPSNLVVTNTQSASFTVVATGVPAVSYQWSKNGTPISGATSATYTIGSTTPSDTASYSVAITNQAGATNSASVTLIVNSTMTPTALSPSNGQTGVCYDTPLYITFSRTPTMRTAGKIRIYNVTNAVTPVDTVDLSLCITANATYAANVQGYNFSGDTITNFPVIITGSKAAIYPHHGLLTSNQTYYVTMDNGTFADSTGAYFAGIAATNTWQFTTKPTGPANSTNVVVTTDGSGDFLTVQGAVDSVPANNTTPTMINIRNGTYTEEVDIKLKNNLAFRGQSRASTIIGYPNNNWVNNNGAPWRAMFIVNANDCSFENLTITNTTPVGGSQAEAIDVEGTRTVFCNMELDSYQDTFLIHSAGKLVYFQDCLIQGQTDFIWGYGSVYFTNCEVRCLLSGGHVTQPRAPFTTNGFGFINCRITQGYSGASTFDLGRTIGTPTSPSEVLYYNCLMADVVTGYSSDAGTNMADYGCSNLTASATKTLANSVHSTSSDAFVVAIQSASTWLYGWAPQLVPNVISQPGNQSVIHGQSASFTVSATGIPAPTYQWRHAGTNLTGATSATLSIASARRSDGGNYSVVVNNGSGTVTSAVATLTYNNTAPSAGAGFSMGALIGISSTIPIVGGKYPPTDADNDAMTITGVTGATNGVVTTDGTSLTYTATNGTVDAFTYTVDDGFSGTSSATVNVTITADVGNYNQVSLVSQGGGTNVVGFFGIPGYNYALDLATNLTPPVNWVPQATNPAAVNGALIFTNVTTETQTFYRTRYAH